MDWYPFEVRDPELLELDFLVPDRTLAALLGPLAGSALAVRDQKDHQVQCVFDAAEGALVGKGLGRFFKRLGTTRFLAALDGDGELQVQPAVDKPPSAWQLELPAGLQQVSVDLEQSAAVLGLLAGPPASFSDYYLRQQAVHLSVSPGFDTLLSLHAVRDIEILDYQVATVRHVLKNLRGRALLCDEVGLGKTIEAGLILMEYLLRGLVRRVLILTPPSLAEQWRTEMHTKFSLDFVLYDDSAFRASADPWGAFDRIIASVDTAKREGRREAVLAETFDMVIVDEAHHLKNRNTQAHRFVSGLKKKYILLLTATPVENDLEELFNLITLLAPGQLETAASFKRKYITPGDPLKPRNTSGLKQLVREVMVRNRRSETGAIHSRRRAEVVRVALAPDEMAFYRRMTAFIRTCYTAGAPAAASASAPVAAPATAGGVSQFVLKTLQREAGSSIEATVPTLKKMAAREEYPAVLRRVLDTLAVQGQRVADRGKLAALLRLLERVTEKAVIFTSFVQTQRLLARTLRERGSTVAELHGQMRRGEKEEQIRFFAAQAQFLVSTDTGSEGRNLQFCRILINYDLPWNPMRIEQRIGRLHRLGQAREVLIYNLSAADTVEAHILELLDAKINMFQLVIGELEMILGNIRDKRDFEDIILDIWARAGDDQAVRREMEALGNQMLAARQHYDALKALDEKLLGELMAGD